jgi:hypothetical protein
MAGSLDEITWVSGADGIGALLMTEPALPRDEFGHPYQPLFWFDAASRSIGLVRDDAGRVMAYLNNPEGDPLLEDPPRCQSLPPDVEVAALRWWAEQESTTG